MTSSDFTMAFGNRTRIRVCGVAIDHDSILLVNHSRLNDLRIWWAPPGGEIKFGETLEEGLIREFKEETGLLIEVEEQMFITEYIKKPLHAVEIFFRVKVLSGELKIGYDPELSTNKQSITDVKYVTFEELRMVENIAKHHCLHQLTQVSEVLNKKGYFPYQKKMNK